MVFDYLVTLKKSDNNIPDQVSQLLYLFALLAFGFFYYQYPKSGVVYLYIGGGIILSWIYNFLKKRKKGEALFRLGLLFAAVGWYVGPEKNIWMAILYAIAALIEKQVKFPKEIGFTEDEISFNSLPKKVLSWKDVNNVIIKDGLLTIDQKNNKLLQKEIEGYVTSSLEKEFNDFCNKCILASNNKVEEV